MFAESLGWANGFRGCTGSGFNSFYAQKFQLGLENLFVCLYLCFLYQFIVDACRDRISGDEGRIVGC